MLSTHLRLLPGELVAQLESANAKDMFACVEGTSREKRILVKARGGNILVKDMAGETVLQTFALSGMDVGPNKLYRIPCVEQQTLQKQFDEGQVSPGRQKRRAFASVHQAKQGIGMERRAHRATQALIVRIPPCILPVHITP